MCKIAVFHLLLPSTSVKFCVFLIHIFKKERKIFLKSLSTFISIFGTSRMQIRKKWLNQLKAFLTKNFKNIIWHLFAGESHQVVKITVTQCSLSVHLSLSSLCVASSCLSKPNRVGGGGGVHPKDTIQNVRQRQKSVTPLLLLLL